jgi:dethiobiotin synthetase
MKKGYFITGTDTNVGKTWTTIALMRYFKKQGQSVVGMKPVASGCLLTNSVLKNEDALLIQENASLPVDYELINPYAYEAPVSPHIAGADNPARLDKIVDSFDRLKELADIVLVEGAGGWLSPINATEDISDLAKVLNLPVIIVVAIKLGCINQAKLTDRAVRWSNLSCAGWIATCTDPDLLDRDETIQAVKASLNAPLLGILPFYARADFDELSANISGDLNKN